MKIWLLKGGLAAIGLAAIGFLVAVSGIVPIKASSGHWPITAWLLHFSMRRSISTHSWGTEVPPLNDPALVLKGAGHYETGCAPCHGNPSTPEPPIAHSMTPHPPYLPPKLSTWESEDLFYIVKHGVKFTGMPAWPALKRDDEVWAMVAFLREYPNLDPEQYRELVFGNAQIPAPTALSSSFGNVKDPATVAAIACARCHGVDGLGRGNGAFPKLAGQSAVYLRNALQAYARGNRHSGVMQPVAAHLTPDTMDALARWYADLPVTVPSSHSGESSEMAIERGRNIAMRGIASQRVPSCSDCHGPDSKRGKPAYPRIAGQYADYLFLQLVLFKKEIRGGSEYAHLMHPVASRLTEEQMRDVALYYASLPWAGATE